MVSKFMVLGHLFVCLLLHKYFQSRSGLRLESILAMMEGHMGRGPRESERPRGTSHEKLPLVPRNMTTRTNH